MSANAASEKFLRFDALRAELAARFPEAPTRDNGCIETGWAALDSVCGGLHRGAVTEFSGSSGNISLAATILLDTVARHGLRAAWVDGGGEFDPEDWPDPILTRLLWIRAETAKQAVQVADLILHDGNLPLVILDFIGLSERELYKIPANTWHRFQRITESNGTSLLTFTQHPIVEGARVRVNVRAPWALDDLIKPRNELSKRVALEIRQRGRHQSPAQIAKAG